MLTLGIHDGHTSTACLFEDGEVLACVSEERINRIKEWTGFPRQAIKTCLQLADKQPDAIDSVGICSLFPLIGYEQYLRPAWHKRAFSYAARVMPAKMLQSPKNIQRVQQIGNYLFAARNKRLRDELRKMGVCSDRVRTYEHHELHASTAYYTSWYRDRKCLVFTLDGSGDAVCATISIGENGKLTRVAEVFNYNSICDFYTRITQYLAMKPMSHEYKVMGMAPYAPEYGRETVMEVFRSYFKIDPQQPLQFLNTSGVWKWQFDKRLARDLKGVRFDVIAGAVQTLFEEVVVQWIQNAIRQFGIQDVVLSGGGFMNVKLNYKVSELSEVDSLFVFPSCGDESNPIGACILSALEDGFPVDAVKPLGMIYWGPRYDSDACKISIDRELKGKACTVSRSEDVNQVIAGHIADGKVVGRYVGRMEWGARALGNRSILADARNSQIVHKINRAIKMRDFWMPFAPAILCDYREKYLKLRSDYQCPYMTIAPDTKEAAWADITAGLHPFDHSTRCQILDPENHPDFYDLVKRYEAITHVGGVLNTSFNLHGDPIVCSPDDAIRTFLDSELEVLQLEDYVVVKNHHGV